jgi:hypothetical protein
MGIYSLCAINETDYIAGFEADCKTKLESNQGAIIAFSVVGAILLIVGLFWLLKACKFCKKVNREEVIPIAAPVSVLSFAAEEQEAIQKYTDSELVMERRPSFTSLDSESHVVFYHRNSSAGME